MIETPLTLPCGVTLPNRLAKSALSEQLGDRDHAPSDRLVRLYERWGEGGCGLLATGNVMVDRRALGEPANVVIEDDSEHERIALWAKAAQSGGARASSSTTPAGSRRARCRRGRSRPAPYP